MKGENLISAIVGGIVAGASFGAGFVIAQKGISKFKGAGKKIESDLAVTKPMKITQDNMSNMTGKGLVHSSQWSNGFGLSPRQIKKATVGNPVPCVSASGSPYIANSASICTEYGGRVVR